MIKRKPNKLAALFLTLVLFVGNSTMTISAEDASLTYNGGKRNIEISTQDLFVGSKNMMPGDTTNQFLSLLNNSNNYITLRVRAEEASGTTKLESELLSKLDLEISVLTTNGIILPYVGKTSGVGLGSGIGNMTSNTGILLGNLSPTGVGRVTIKITAPTKLANEYQNAVAKVKWIFICEYTEPQYSSQTVSSPPITNVTTYDTTRERRRNIPDYSVPLISGVTVGPLPVSGVTAAPVPNSQIAELIPEDEVPLIDAPGTGTNPKTGDYSNYVLLTVLLVCSFTCILVLLKKKKSSNKIKK